MPYQGASGQFSLKAASLCLLLVSAARSQSLISQIGWKGANAEIIAGVLSILGCSLMLLTFLYVRSRRKSIKDVEELSRKLFSDACERAELNDTELEYLGTLLSYEDGLKPHLIFEMAGIFEKCMDAHVNNLLNRQLIPELLEEEDLILGSVRSKLGYTYLPLEHPLLSTRNISIGQKLSLFTQNKSNPILQNCTLVHMGECFFTVQCEDQNEILRHITQGNGLTIAFTRQCDGVYSISVPVKYCDGVRKLELYHTLEFKRNQMRQYLRMEVNLPLKFRVLERAQGEKLNSQQYTSRIGELSGGGLSFFAQQSFLVGDILSVSVHLPDGAVSGIKAKIMRVTLLEGKSSDQFKHHVQFTSIDSKDRERIVHFIFDKQRQVNQMR